MKRVVVVAILLLAFDGLADSLYLADHEANGTPLICTVQHLTDCNIVTESRYSRLFGIPVAEFGVLFFSSLFVFAALELVLYDRLIRRILQGFAFVGLLSSLISAFMQVFVIQALCIYCLASAAISLLIFVLAVLIEPLPTRGRQMVLEEVPLRPAERDGLTIPPR